MSARVNPRSEPKGLKAKPFGKDDALDAFFVSLEELAKGVIGIMAFRHVQFMFQACNVLLEHTGDERFKLWAQMFIIQDEASIHRNLRLMRAQNKFREEHGLPQYDIPEAPETPIEELSAKAEQLGVNISGYFDESYDPANIEGMTLFEEKYNTFCLNALEKIGGASDLIPVFQDTDGVYHLLVIARANAPGIGELSLPGGFKEANETFMEACKREGGEETNFFDLVTGYKVFQKMLPVFESKTWDPRLRFAVHGMRNAGLLWFSSALTA
jgi:hypothetical protein